MTSAINTHGITLTIAGTAIAQLTSITGVKKTRATREVTAHDSSNSYLEHIAGLKDSTEIIIKGYFKADDTNGQIALDTALEAGTLTAFVLTFPTAITATWTFNALVTGFSPGDFPVDDKLEFTATLKPSGKPTLAITASTGMSSLTGIEENAGAALTFLPTFAIGTYTYTTTVNTASTYIKLTPTAASHTITISNGSEDQEVTSGAQSGEIDLGAAGTVTTVTVVVQESGKTKKTYTIYVSRP